MTELDPFVGLDEVDCDPDHAFEQDADGVTRVAPEQPDWTLDPQ